MQCTCIHGYGFEYYYLYTRWSIARMIKLFIFPKRHVSAQKLLPQATLLWLQLKAPKR